MVPQGTSPLSPQEQLDLGNMARACGFEHCYSATDEEELIEAVFRGLNDSNLSFIHVIVKPDDMKISPVPIEPITLKNRFMETI